MRKLLVFSFWLLVFSCWLIGCSSVTYHVQQPTKSVDPGNEAYKYVLIRNESPFFVKFSIGTESIVLDPGAEVVTKKIRPLGWLSPSFGQYRLVAYAYRGYQNGYLDEFVGQIEYYIRLDGYPRVYNGRVFGDVIILSYFPVSTFGHPDHWGGNFLGIIPWDMKFRHK